MADNIGIMAKRKISTGDRHKPGRMVRLKEQLARQLDILVVRNATNTTQEVQRAVREMLAREGLWPPPLK